VDAQRGKALGDDADKVAGTSLDKGHELDALAKMPAGQRADLVERAARGENVSAVKASPPVMFPEPAKVGRGQKVCTTQTFPMVDPAALSRAYILARLRCLTRSIVLSVVTPTKPTTLKAMSRGHGKIELAILQRLSGRGAITDAREILNLCADGRPVSRVLRSSVNRALRNLCRAGLIVEYVEHDHKFFTLSDRHKRRQQRKQRDQWGDDWWERRRQERERAELEAKAITKELPKLTKVLAMLGSEYAGERDAAARQVEIWRRKTGKSWEEIFNLLFEARLIAEKMRQMGIVAGDTK
jgi:hypothetical protein